MITGRLELTIKISQMPEAQTVENGWQRFEVDCDGRIVTITVKPKVWKKLTDSAATYPQWVAAIRSRVKPEAYRRENGRPNRKRFRIARAKHSSFRAKISSKRSRTRC